MSLMVRLKAETSIAHDRIEDEVGLAGRLASKDAYRGLVERFYGFHRVWEPEAAAALADEAFFGPRRKTAFLERDLLSLGLTHRAIAALPRCRSSLVPPSRAAALGALYVLEGSTLGGALIAREVERSLGLTAGTGCAYFRAYGRETAAMWRALGAHLEANVPPGRDDEVVAGARAAFERLRVWLAPVPDGVAVAA
ncbi:MAG TPA: biliverdin-producing heme oxygenase [Salinarimonas sp.]|nr:biliverdin-producing heme oxygenase [Salinarimonas sp.]